MSAKIKKGDNVIVLSGKDKGKNGKVLNYENKIKLDNENPIKIKNDDKDISNETNNSENQHVNATCNEFIDKEIYEKFLMFLQFQEEMKKRN